MKSAPDLVGQFHRHHVIRLLDLLPLVALDRLDLVLVVPLPDRLEVTALMPNVKIRPRVPLRLDPVVGDDAYVSVAHDVLLHNVQTVGEVSPMQLSRMVAVFRPQVVIVVEGLADRVETVQLVEDFHLRDVRVGPVAPVFRSAHRLSRILTHFAHVVFANDDNPDLGNAIPGGVYFRTGLFAVDGARYVEEGAIEREGLHRNVESIQKWCLKDRSVFADQIEIVLRKKLTI